MGKLRQKWTQLPESTSLPKDNWKLSPTKLASLTLAKVNPTVRLGNFSPSGERLSLSYFHYPKVNDACPLAVHVTGALFPLP